MVRIAHDYAILESRGWRIYYGYESDWTIVFTLDGNERWRMAPKFFGLRELDHPATILLHAAAYLIDQLED